MSGIQVKLFVYKRKRMTFIIIKTEDMLSTHQREAILFPLRYVHLVCFTLTPLSMYMYK